MIQTNSKEPEISDAVYREICNCVMIRRTITTGIEDLNQPGTIRYPRDQMPSFNVRTEILGYTGVRAQQVADITQRLLRALPIDPSDCEDGMRIIDGDRGPREEKSKGRINMGIHCLNTLLAQDWKTFVATMRPDGISKLSNQAVDELLSRMSWIKEYVKAPRRATKDARTDTHSGSAPILGAAYIEILQALGVDGGLGYLFALNCNDGRALPPLADRASMGRYCMSDSPAMWRTVELVLDNKDEGRKTLVLCHNQTIQQLITLILLKLSINALSVRRTHSMKRIRCMPDSTTWRTLVWTASS
ncbi:hypothetical protein QBC47DRAFT_403605 [Echria macrotheca]|uniref:Uncharacterized protein n=1 Tax=Echria macrotheca TaxID=438768 RepID=A0AAJ0BBE8_9PEZI|nr:hypothetical protein QBC47DRAFT_403605 [Echria macrotheca]